MWQPNTYTEEIIEEVITTPGGGSVIIETDIITTNPPVYQPMGPAYVAPSVVQPTVYIEPVVSPNYFPNPTYGVNENIVNVNVDVNNAGHHHHGHHHGHHHHGHRNW